MYTKKVYVLIVTFACFLLGSRVAVSLDMQATARSEHRCKNSWYLHSSTSKSLQKQWYLHPSTFKTL